MPSVEERGASPSSGHRRALVVIVVAVALADWISKVAAAVWLDNGPVEIGSVLSLRLGHNPGIAFGVGDRLPDGLLLLLTVAVTALLVLAVLRGVFPTSAATGLVLGGAMANLADRAIGGTVVDFLDLGWWPSFNVADAALSVGCALLVVASFSEAPTHRAEAS